MASSSSFTFSSTDVDAANASSSSSARVGARPQSPSRAPQTPGHGDHTGMHTPPMEAQSPGIPQTVVRRVSASSSSSSASSLSGPAPLELAPLPARTPPPASLLSTGPRSARDRLALQDVSPGSLSPISSSSSGSGSGEERLRAVRGRKRRPRQTALDRELKSEAWQALARRQQRTEMSIAERVVQDELYETRPGFVLPDHAAEAQRAQQAQWLAIQNDQARIDAFQRAYQHGRDLIRTVVGALTDIDERLATVEELIRPVHQSTRGLRTAHANLDATIALVHEYLAYRHTAAAVRDVLQQGARLDSYPKTIDAIARLQRALDFYLAHPQFHDSQRYAKLMRHSVNRGLDNLEGMATTLIGQRSARASILSDSLRIMLCDVSTVLAARDRLAFLGVYAEARGAALLEAVQEAAGGAGDTTAIIPVFCEALARERALAEQVLPSAHFDDHWFTLVAPAVDGVVTYTRTELDSAQDDHCRTMLLMVRVLACLSTYIVTLQQSLKSIDGSRTRTTTIITLFHDLNLELRERLALFVTTVKAHDPKSVPVDGTVHEHVANTLGHVRRLLEYSDFLETRLPAVTWRESTVSFAHAESPIVEFIHRVLHALRINLVNKAKSYKKRSIQSIFLLNNYHYILTTISSSDLAPMVDAAMLQRLTAERQTQRLAFLDCWAPVMEPLLDVNQQIGEPSHVSSKADRDNIKRRFNKFNNEFERLFEDCLSFAVPDHDLRLSLRAASIERILDLYRRFVQKYENVPFAKNKGKYLRITPDTLAEMIGRFFP